MDSKTNCNQIIDVNNQPESLWFMENIVWIADLADDHGKQELCDFMQKKSF